MKRSEAFTKFYELACSAEEDGWLDNPMCVADNFLKLAEDIGMIPPKIELGDSGWVKTTEILDYTELDYDIIWEPESED